MGGGVNRRKKAQGAFPPWAHFADAPPLPRVQSDTDTITTQYTPEQFHFCNSSYQICKLLRSQLVARPPQRVAYRREQRAEMRYVG